LCKILNADGGLSSDWVSCVINAVVGTIKLVPGIVSLVQYTIQIDGFIVPTEKFSVEMGLYNQYNLQLYLT
jgi:hypothetical protein